MTDINTDISVAAVQLVSKRPVHVADNITIFSTTLDKLESSGDNLVKPADMIIYRGNVTTLSTCQDDMRGGADDKKPKRDKAYSVCFGDNRTNMLKVEGALIGIPNPMDKEALILRNGYGVGKEHGPISNPDISIKNKKNQPGTVVAKIKSPSKTKSYSVDWQSSTDNGETWTPHNSTPVCKRELKNMPLASQLIVRARITIGSNDPEGWKVSSTLVVGAV